MNEHEHLGSIIANEQFPIVDHKLRRGAHISIEDVELYDFIRTHVIELSKFYNRYDARLLEGAEGYYYLISQGAMFGQRQLSKSEMVIGLTIAHLYRDPEHQVKGTGQLTVDQVITRLETLKSKDDIARLVTESKVKSDLHPSKVREAVLDAIKKLAGLNFLFLLDPSSGAFRCKRPIHRFDQFVSQIDPGVEADTNGGNHENR
jgi:chromosome condensin MukBEF MukE localization factor